MCNDAQVRLECPHCGESITIYTEDFDDAWPCPACPEMMKEDTHDPVEVGGDIDKLFAIESVIEAASQQDGPKGSPPSETINPATEKQPWYLTPLTFLCLPFVLAYVAFAVFLGGVMYLLVCIMGFFEEGALHKVVAVATIAFVIGLLWVAADRQSARRADTKQFDGWQGHVPGKVFVSFGREHFSRRCPLLDSEDPPVALTSAQRIHFYDLVTCYLCWPLEAFGFDSTVFVDRVAGDKYHGSRSCPGVRRATQIDTLAFAEARKLHYQPCTVCAIILDSKEWWYTEIENAPIDTHAE